MWVPKWFIESQIRQYDDLNRRVKRLELTLMKNAQNTIANLQDENAGSASKDGILTIEEILNK